MKELNQEPVENSSISRINSAGIINITIENLWRDCYNAMSNGKLMLWNRKLDAIWTILGGEKDITKEIETKIIEFDTKIYELGSLDVKTQGFQPVPQQDRENRVKQYLLLKDKSLFLRRLQNTQGKGTAYVDEDEDYM